jgi:hypothetical protein
MHGFGIEAPHSEAIGEGAMHSAPPNLIYGGKYYSEAAKCGEMDA